MAAESLPQLPRDVHDAVCRFAARERIVLATDFDGTLAPFVSDPMQARAADGALDLLREASTLPGVTVALVSGRALDVLRVLTDVTEDEDIVLIGTHGAQSSLVAGSGTLTAEQSALLAELERGLAEVVAAHPGAWVEHKPAGVVLHTRDMPPEQGAAALDAAAEVAARHPGTHPLRGKNVQEIGVLDANKGSALVALAEHVGAEAILYLGDDVTDERAFAVLDAARGDVAVKVGEGDTVAPFRVADIPSVVAVLHLAVSTRLG